MFGSWGRKLAIQACHDGLLSLFSSSFTWVLHCTSRSPTSFTFYSLVRRSVSFDAGEDISIEWLYVGNNQLFDIYVRQGDGDSSKRVSENLCAGEAQGSCTASNVGQATVTLPAELTDGADYTLLVVDKADDNAYGISESLSVGISVASTGDSAESRTATRVGLVIGGSVLGACTFMCKVCWFETRVLFLYYS